MTVPEPTVELNPSDRPEPRSGQPAGEPAADSPVAGLDQLAFWGVFLLCCALVSPPIAVPAAAAGTLCVAVAYRKAGQARSPEAPDDIQFTRFFLAATLVCYLVMAATGSQIGIWFMMLCGMFLLHCARNLMIVEKLIVSKPAEPLEALEETPARAPQEILESLQAALEGLGLRQRAAGHDATATDGAASAVTELARRHFLLVQKGALFLTDGAPPAPGKLRTDLERTRASLEGEADPERVRALGLQVASLERILAAAEAPDELLRAFRGTMLAVEDALDTLDAELEENASSDSLDLPGWVALGLGVLRATVEQAEADLAHLQTALAGPAPLS